MSGRVYENLRSPPAGAPKSGQLVKWNLNQMPASNGEVDITPEVMNGLRGRWKSAGDGKIEGVTVSALEYQVGPGMLSSWVNADGPELHTFVKTVALGRPLGSAPDIKVTDGLSHDFNDLIPVVTEEISPSRLKEAAIKMFRWKDPYSAGYYVQGPGWEAAVTLNTFTGNVGVLKIEATDKAGPKNSP